MACAWTAQLQGFYAPELSPRMAGFAMGGTPVNVHEVAHHIQNSIAAGLALGVFIGLSNTYSQVAQYLKDNLTPEGDKLYDLPRSNCFTKFMLAALNKDVLGRDYWKMDDPLESEVILPILDTLKCGESTDESQIPKSAPLCIVQSYKDEVVPLQQVDDLVDKWSKAGAAIEYIRDETPGHIVLSFTSLPMILKWLKHRVEGTPSAAQPGAPVIKNVKTSLLIKDQDEAKEMREYDIISGIDLLASESLLIFQSFHPMQQQSTTASRNDYKQRWTSSKKDLGSHERCVLNRVIIREEIPLLVT